MTQIFYTSNLRHLRNLWMVTFVCHDLAQALLLLGKTHDIGT